MVDSSALSNHGFLESLLSQSEIHVSWLMLRGYVLLA